MGADYIEPDLVSTKDHQLVVRHEPAIGATTDVADHSEFATRRTTKVIDGVTIADDWFTDDFTLPELETLYAKERLPDVRQRNTIYNKRYRIPTFQDVIDVRDELSRELHRQIGIVPELKHSTYFRSEGLPLEEPFVATLRRNHIDNAAGKVTVQSFEVGNLKQLNRLLPGVPLVQLLDARTLKPGDVLASGGTLTYGQMATPAGLRDIASYADVASPSKDYIVPRDPTTGASLAPTSFISDAHRAGLDVVAYTFRNENQFLPAELRSDANPNDYGNAIAEYQCSSSSASTGSSPTTPTRPGSRGTRNEARHRRGGRDRGRPRRHARTGARRRPGSPRGARHPARRRRLAGALPRCPQPGPGARARLR